MKTNKILALITGCVISTLGFSQQFYQHSQYQTNPYLFNPAASGIYDYIDISMGFRQQWTGINNAPRTYFLSGHSAINLKRPIHNPSLRTGRMGPVRTPKVETGKPKHVIGGFLFGDEYGAFRQLNAMASYAYHLPVAYGYNLSFGVALGYSSHRFLSDKVEMLSELSSGIPDPTYTNFQAAGPNQGHLNASAGLWFYSEELFIGYSSAQLLKSMVKFGAPYTNFNLHMHHYLTAGYKIPLNRTLSLTPSFLVKYMAPAPISIDISATLTYDEWIWGGLSYRHGDALIAMIGLNINQFFKFGYSYDFTISDLAPVNSGSHEIVLGLTLGNN